MLADPELDAIVRFAISSMEYADVPEKDSERKRRVYSFRPDLFTLALREWEVPDGPPMREAREWVNLVIASANLAQQAARLRARERAVRRVEEKRRVAALEAARERLRQQQQEPPRRPE